ncbi:MAG: hypothetical protein M3Q14_00190 [bacterium]|nr:hypothetical protein [bacterium]
MTEKLRSRRQILTQTANHFLSDVVSILTFSQISLNEKADRKTGNSSPGDAHGRKAS